MEEIIKCERLGMQFLVIFQSIYFHSCLLETNDTTTNVKLCLNLYYLVFLLSFSSDELYYHLIFETFSCTFLLVH